MRQDPTCAITPDPLLQQPTNPIPPPTPPNFASSPPNINIVSASAIVAGTGDGHGALPPLEGALPKWPPTESSVVTWQPFCNSKSEFSFHSILWPAAQS